MHTRDARTAYNLGAGDLFKLQKSLRGAEPAKIVYHSHVDGGIAATKTARTSATPIRRRPSWKASPPTRSNTSSSTSARDGVRGAAQFAWDASTSRYVEVGRYPPG